METDIFVDERSVEKEEEKKTSWVSWTVFIISLVLIFIIVRFVIGVVTISGNSMNPTIEDGDLLVTSNLFYTVERNDMIVFRDDNGFNVIKRVIGLPNDRIAIQDGAVLVNGEVVNETYTTGLSNDMEEIIVPSQSYFVLGDNRTPGESLDSRDHNMGSIDEINVLGEVMISLVPLSLESIK